MKCRVTADGSKIKMPDTSTNNASMEHVRILLHMAATHEKYTGDVLTADAEQGYLQAPAEYNDIYMLPPKLHPDCQRGRLWRLKKNMYG